MSTNDRRDDQRLTLNDQHKTFRLPHALLFNVSAILVADTVAASAAIGVQGLTLWIALAVLFLIPCGLLTAELGGAWPQEGGPYVWIREAFGRRAATMCAWLYWVTMGYYLPGGFLLFTGTLVTVFIPGLSRGQEEAVILGLIWAVVGICVLPLSVTKWLTAANAAVKIVLLVGLFALGLIYALEHGVATSFALSEWVPAWGSNWAFIPVIWFSYLGFELIGTVGAGVKNPSKSVPRAVIGSAIIVLVVYIISTFGILAAIKPDQVSIVTGVADATKLMFAQVLGGASWLYYVAMVALLYTFVSGMITWTTGSNHTIAAKGLDETRPGFLGHVNQRFASPDYAAVVVGVIATVLTVMNYALFSRRDDIFWTVFAVSTIVGYGPPYVFMYASFLRLRYTQPDTPRPYVVPGGKFVAWLCVLLSEGTLFFSLTLFFVAVPEGTPRITYWSILGGGLAGSVLVAWLLYRKVPNETSIGPDLVQPNTALQAVGDDG